MYECEFHGVKDLDDDNDEDNPRFQTLQWNFGKKKEELTMDAKV